MPPNMRSGPEGADPRSRREVDALAKVPDTAMVANGIPRRSRPLPGDSRKDAITTRVSLLVPDEFRRWWHYLARCPVCGRPHVGRSRELDGATGIRKLPCRHWVDVVVARSYSQQHQGGAA
jgi:hypothetical protein